MRYTTHMTRAPEGLPRKKGRAPDISGARPFGVLTDLLLTGPVRCTPAYFAACSSSYFSMAACSSALGQASAAAWASAMEAEPTGLLPSSAGAGSA